MDNGAQTHLHSVTRMTSSTTSTNIKTWRVATGKHSSTCMQVSQHPCVHERCRDFYEKQRAGTAPADSSLGGGEMDRRDTCLKGDELYKCRTMFGRNVTCITGLTDQGNQKKTRPGVPATSSESSVALCAVNKVHGWPCLHSHLLIHKSHCNIQTKCIQLLGQVTAAPAWQDILI